MPIFPPSPTLTEDNLPSQAGKVFIITGGTSGIGYELCRILYQIGGTPALLKFLLKEGVIKGEHMTVTGQTMKKNLETAPDFPSDQTIIKPFSQPIKKTGHLQILYGYNIDVLDLFIGVF